MTRSMTGFGRVSAEIDGENVTIEVTTVNHRFLECSFRMPNTWAALEIPLRNVAKDLVSRGKLNVSIRRSRGPMGRPVIHFDAENARQYIEASRELARMMSSTEALSLDALTQLEGVFYQEENEQDLESVREQLCAAFQAALEQLNQARAQEGESLARDVADRIAAMQDAVSIIEGRLPELAVAYADRLRARVAELNAEAGMKEERLAIEIALMADKMDVNEEVVRLNSHFEQVLGLLKQPEPIGRDLNFLAQELQREINTLGSKLRDLDVTREVLRLKAELEKLREQAQNIE
ncbi:MAG: YicC family protein [Candidatus Hydrogenedentes bacterium]|nr:YicC family protein [Candidatus Hydrogenedentota bacterium]